MSHTATKQNPQADGEKTKSSEKETKPRHKDQNKQKKTHQEPGDQRTIATHLKD